MLGDAIRLAAKEWLRSGEREASPLARLERAVSAVSSLALKPVKVELPRRVTYEADEGAISLEPFFGKQVLRYSVGGVTGAVLLSSPPLACEVLAISAALADPEVGPQLERLMRRAGLESLLERASRGAAELRARLPPEASRRILDVFRILWSVPAAAALTMHGGGRWWMPVKGRYSAFIDGEWVGLEELGSSTGAVAAELVKHATAVRAALEAILGL